MHRYLKQGTPRNQSLKPLTAARHLYYRFEGHFGVQQKNFQVDDQCMQGWKVVWLLWDAKAESQIRRLNRFWLTCHPTLFVAHPTAIQFHTSTASVNYTSGAGGLGHVPCTALLPLREVLATSWLWIMVWVLLL